jgi:hypothetical protein
VIVGAARIAPRWAPAARFRRCRPAEPGVGARPRADFVGSPRHGEPVRCLPTDRFDHPAVIGPPAAALPKTGPAGEASAEPTRQKSIDEPARPASGLLIQQACPSQLAALIRLRMRVAGPGRMLGGRPVDLPDLGGPGSPQTSSIEVSYTTLRPAPSNGNPNDAASRHTTVRAQKRG